MIGRERTKQSLEMVLVCVLLTSICHHHAFPKNNMSFSLLSFLPTFPVFLSPFAVLPPHSCCPSSSPFAVLLPHLCLSFYLTCAVLPPHVCLSFLLTFCCPSSSLVLVQAIVEEWKDKYKAEPGVYSPAYNPEVQRMMCSVQKH